MSETPRDRYRIFETRRFQQDLAGLDPPLRDQLQAKLVSVVYPALQVEPYFGPSIRKLRDWRPETWRYRLGSWRVFYQIEEAERIVFAIALDVRKDAYRRR